MAASALSGRPRRLRRERAIEAVAPWRERVASADLTWLCLLALVVLGAGLGLRDPWPADEPRFALIARDMLANGQWLVPRVGDSLYPDKPPFYFWVMALSIAATGSMRAGFLLPCLAAGIGTLVLVHDLARRLWNRETALAAALLLLVTPQFALQARAAQIDGFLLFWTTLSLYGLARHLLLGPAWGWYALGGFAAGIGVITKGVGFLPLLLLVPYVVLRIRWDVPRTGDGRWRWALAPTAALAAIALWLVPMLIAVASRGDPAWIAYRDEILLHQTVDRYAAAWHHLRPAWYFVVNVIPGLWLPATALLPWLVGGWRRAAKDRDARVWLFLSWAALVVLFFSLSPGKRGVYVLPALPAFILAVAPQLPTLARRAGPQRVGAALTFVLALVALGAALFLGSDADRAQALRAEYDVSGIFPLVLVALLCIGALLACGRRRGLSAYAVAFCGTLVIQGLWINPLIDAARSGRKFVAELERAVPARTELGIVAWREQFLLQLSRPVTSFGHARWREGRAEMDDAARWLNAVPGRALLVDDSHRAPCFTHLTATPVGQSGGDTWSIVTGRANPICAAAGDTLNARVYVPPYPRAP